MWWAELDQPAGQRPVLLLSRDEAYAVRALVIVAPITTRVRGIPTEVAVGPTEGLPRPSAVNLDVLVTVPKDRLRTRLGALPPAKLAAVQEALRFALGLGP